MISKEKTFRLTKVQQIPSLYEVIQDIKILYLKLNIKFRGLGAEWEAIQFICSVQRLNKSIHMKLDSQLIIDDIKFNEPLPLISIYQSNEVEHKNIDKRDILLEKFIPFVRLMNSIDIPSYLRQKKTEDLKFIRKFQFICLGGARNEYLNFFYSNRVLKDKESIERFLRNILRYRVRLETKSNFPIERLKDICEIVYEAFSNAARHGSISIDSKKIYKSVRALDISFINLTKTDIPPLVKNYRHLEDLLTITEKLLFISIFDNGEGIVKKYVEALSSDKEATMSFEEKAKVLQRVFMPNVTSSKDPNSGMGLTYIKNNIQKLNGALSISTGNLYLNMTPHRDGTGSITYNDSAIEEVPYRVGTLIFIIIPLSNASK